MDKRELLGLVGLSPQGRSRAELEAMIAGFGRAEAWAAAGRLAAMAAIDALGDDGVSAEGVARAKTKRSKKACKRAAKTAKQLSKMPKTRAALAAGEINEEHADAVADAAERVSPEQADEQLSGDAKHQPADMFTRASRSWANSREAQDQRHERHQRQRSKRDVGTWTDADGMCWFLLGLDPVAGAEVLKAFQAERDRLWREDGGRDGSPDEVRTFAQRGADALFNLITASAATSSPASAAKKRSHPRYQVMVRVDADRLRGNDPTGIAEFIDGTPLSESVLERIACEAEFAGAIYGADGAVLWQGRRMRTATDDQWSALIARDSGCVICAADPAYCQAHHLKHWAPPTNGHTNIDNMALVCNSDHHLIHDHGHQLVNHNGEWTLTEPEPGQKKPGRKKQRPPPNAVAA